MTLIMLLFVVGLAAAGYLLHALNPAAVKIEKDKKTALALAEAKAAIIGWSAKNDIPGQLPCPEDVVAIGTVNEGQQEAACSNINPTIGRLPWRTLGIGDLRDGYGERLWYALSPGFRVSPINSDTPAQLMVDGVAGSAVAIIFSAGPVVNGQVRPTPTNVIPPDAIQYLDLSNNDGDSAFITSGALGNFNDHLLLVSHDELFAVVEKRVAREVVNALNDYFVAYGHYPLPADFADITCLGGAAINVGCDSMIAGVEGRVPVSPAGPWNPTSILRGTIGAGNWFQSNQWRELTYYAVSSLCSDGTSNCLSGDLSVLSPPFAAAINQKLVVISAGRMLGAARDSVTLTDFLEEENASSADRIFSRVTTTNMPFNDVLVSAP